MTEKNLIILLSAMIGAVVVMGGTLAWWAIASSVSLNSTSLCPMDGKITGHVMILVDQTDSLTPGQVHELKAEVEELKAGLSVYARLSIITISKDVEIPPPFVFSLCNPGRGDQVNPLNQTPSFAQASFDAQFSKPLDDVLSTFELPSTEVQSPIMETIDEVTKLTSFNASIPNRHLVIFSDLLQNTTQLSQYTWTPITFEQFQKTMGGTELPDLSEASVDIFYLPRPSAQNMQGPQHRQFWVDFFKASGASSINWCGVGFATLKKEVIECVPASNS